MGKQKAPRRVAENELDEPVPVTSTDETGELTESFNEMVEAVGERELAAAQHGGADVPHGGGRVGADLVRQLAGAGDGVGSDPVREAERQRRAADHAGQRARLPGVDRSHAAARDRASDDHRVRDVGDRDLGGVGGLAGDLGAGIGPLDRCPDLAAPVGLHDAPRCSARSSVRCPSSTLNALSSRGVAPSSAIAAARINQPVPTGEIEHG